MTKIILATSSKSRIKAFKSLGLEFIAQASYIDEYNRDRPKEPKELVKYLAKKKAETVAKNFSNDIVIGFDSVGYFDNRILEKPRSKSEAFDRLRSLSGNMHEYYTGIYMINLESRENLSEVVKTRIYMRKLNDKEINRYLGQDNFNAHVLGYNPLFEYSSTFIYKIKGSHTNLIHGIPLGTIVRMLNYIGFKTY